jgi:hypothetical protein
VFFVSFFGCRFLFLILQIVTYHRSYVTTALNVFLQGANLQCSFFCGASTVYPISHSSFSLLSRASTNHWKASRDGTAGKLTLLFTYCCSHVSRNGISEKYTRPINTNALNEGERYWLFLWIIFLCSSLTNSQVRTTRRYWTWDSSASSISSKVLHINPVEPLLTLVSLHAHQSIRTCK